MGRNIGRPADIRVLSDGTTDLGTKALKEYKVMELIVVIPEVVSIIFLFHELDNVGGKLLVEGVVCSRDSADGEVNGIKEKSVEVV